MKFSVFEKLFNTVQAHFDICAICLFEMHFTFKQTENKMSQKALTFYSVQQFYNSTSVSRCQLNP